MKLYWCLFLISVFLPPQKSSLGGLKFHGGEQSIDNRTSYNVFGDKTVQLSDRFDIEFDISLYSTTEIGYILRIKNDKSDRIYNLFYDGQGDNYKFNFNEEGKSNLMVANLDRDELINLQWFKIRISFDLKNDSIKLSIHDNTFGVGNIGLPKTYSPIILYGKSDHIIDVPSFAIKDLHIGNNEKYIFPLKENEGSIVYNRRGKATGEVVNPEWLINDSYYWKYIVSFESKSVAGANYNPEKKEFYNFNRDTLCIYNVRSAKTQIIPFDEKCPVELVLGTNFIDSSNNKLYAYEVYCDATYDGPTVASLDLDTYQWRVESYEQLPTQLHHHVSYFIPDAEQYTLFGGFGNMHYSKDFFLYDVRKKEWSKLEDFSGDFLPPRYFSSVGCLNQTNSMYIFGGMGNESGDQTVGRKYYYDLYKVDLSTNNITQLWKIPWEHDNVVPARDMVVLNDSCFYTLCYPEHFSDSFLKLYRFSLNDGSYEILGDSIPIHSDKISTNANLYYDKELSCLYAVVQEFDDDISSNLKIYSLTFPPITEQELKSFSRNQSNVPNSLIIILFASMLLVGVGYVLFKKLKCRHANDKSVIPNLNGTGNTTKIRAIPNSIYLFGDFLVRDRNNKDITYMFSAKLRQVFCLILQYSKDDGISSQRLSSTLWPDKPAVKVKNSRGVTINHLRKVLGEMDGVELIYENGCFRIVESADFYCDYSRCIQLISMNQPEELSKKLVKIVSRGKFLKLSDHPLFDSFKEMVERKLEPVLLLEAQKSYESESYQTTIDLTEAIFNIDPLSGAALAFHIKTLQKLKLSEVAKIRYQAFLIEYKNTMGNDYPYPLKV